MEWERRVETAYTSDEMVFKATNRFLGGVGAVDVRGHELKGDVVSSEKLFKRVRTLVVEDLEGWFQPAFGEVAVQGGCCSD